MSKRHIARKRFGQNFLVDPNIIGKIVNSIGAAPGQTLIEIGPGMGALTDPLLETGADLLVLEIDRDLAETLELRYSNQSNFSMLCGDALKFDFSDPSLPEQYRVVGNLPYNISTPLIFRLLAYKHRIKNMIFMLQSEVVDRMAAEPGGKEYGRLSVMVQYHCNVERLLNVPPSAFRPAPKVMSAIVGLTPTSTAQANKKLDDALATIVRAAFASRRKTLRNNLRELLPEQEIEACGINPGARAETVSVSEFVLLAHALRGSDHVTQEMS